MLFYFLISIVFIAEIIVTFAIVFHMVKLDRKLIEYNEFVEEVKPLVKDIMVTTRKLSEEFAKLAPMITEKIKIFAINMVKEQIKGFLGTLVFWLVKKEVEKHA